ncbi:MAG TPA: hypothetical protein VFL93_08915 [Longimicrobiaceae bacterium]|nr:hypothetical protein [Longimicrobiaceae bacterium]
MHRRTVVATITALTAACTTPYPSYVEHDPIRAETITHMDREVIGGFNLLRGNLVLAPERVQGDRGGLRYDFLLQWRGSDAFSIDRHAPLEIRADTATLRLPSLDTVIDVHDCTSAACAREQLGEQAHYAITRAQLRQMAQARALAVRVQGAQGALARVFTAENRASIKRFVDAYVGAVSVIR